MKFDHLVYNKTYTITTLHSQTWVSTRRHENQQSRVLACLIALSTETTIEQNRDLRKEIQQFESSCFLPNNLSIRRLHAMFALFQTHQSRFSCNYHFESNLATITSAL